MFSSQIYRATFVNHRCTGGFTYFALHFIHATFCIEPRTICRIENGSQKFSLCKLEKLSEIFEVDLQQIKNIFFAEKFAKEAYQNNCSNAVFIVAMRIIENIDNSILNKKTI